MDERDHLPPAPLGYYWRVTINMPEQYANVSLYPNCWAHLNPGHAQGHGMAIEPGMTRADVYRKLVDRAWLGQDVAKKMDAISAAWTKVINGVLRRG